MLCHFSLCVGYKEPSTTTPSHTQHSSTTVYYRGKHVHNIYVWNARTKQDKARLHCDGQKLSADEQMVVVEDCGQVSYYRSSEWVLWCFRRSWLLTIRPLHCRVAAALFCLMTFLPNLAHNEGNLQLGNLSPTLEEPLLRYSLILYLCSSWVQLRYPE